jgi:hypothetical protein
MPVHQRKPPPRHSRSDLVEELARELKKHEGKPGPGIPDVYEEEQPYGDSLHVTVIWDKWSDVREEERGAIILDAYEQAKKDDVPRITMVLGLTPDEAKRLGIDTTKE